MTKLNLTNFENFFQYCNDSYLKQSMPNDQSSKSNFSDISNNNNENIVKILDELSNNSIIPNKYINLIKNIYNAKLNFEKTNTEQSNNVCSKIKNIMTLVDNASTLIEKVCILSDHGISLFISYGTGENSKDGNPYILNVGKCGLSFSKDYYFDSKYKNELEGYAKYKQSVLNHLISNYSVFNDLNNNISDDVEHIEQLLAPYILSNVNKRDVIKRTNIYKLNEINSEFKNLGLSSSCFLNEYKLTDKLNIDVIFSNDLKTCKMNNSSNHYHENLDFKECFDNGEYYWYFLDDLFKKYDNDENRSSKNKIDNYIKWKIINNFMSLISEELRVMKFNFYSKFLNGQKEEKNVKERSINYLMDVVPELIGKVFCDNFFTSDHKKLMKELINYLLNAYEHNFINKCEWIYGSTNEALNKLKILNQDLNQKIGYPEECNYKNKYDKLFDLLDTLNMNDQFTLFDFELILTKWNQELDIEKLSMYETDMNEWEMSPVMTNAYFHPLKNEIVFPAGILQEPFFIYLTQEEINNKGIDISNHKRYVKLLEDRVRLSNEHPSLNYITMASNFGSIGAVIGHEISHAFDDNGSKYDSNGKLNEWWSSDVKQKYENITSKLVDQYNKYSLDLTINDSIQTFQINGKLTLGENIADLFGLVIAIDAYKMFYEQHKQNKTLDDGLLELFVSFSNTWRYIELPEKTKNRVAIDVHSPPMFRVNGTLANIKEFHRLFSPNEPCIDIVKIFNDDNMYTINVDTINIDTLNGLII